MAKPAPSILKRILDYFTGGQRESTLSGSRYTKSISTSHQRKLDLDVPEIPLRPILNSLSYSHELLEIETWCYEAKHGVFRMASDCFQQIDGVVGSWYVPEEMLDKTPINPEVIQIGNKELATRMCGKHLVLGGTRLRRAIVEALHGGDSFVELEISKGGISRNDWCISDSLYLPRYSVFVKEDEHGRIQGYEQRVRLQPSADDILIDPLKILHFSYDQKGSYGMPITFQSLEPWRQLKECSADLEQAARDCGVAPWLHIMPEEASETYKDVYQQRHESSLGTGILTNLYLMNGADVRKAATDADTLAPLMNYWLSKRYHCLPPGIPHWFFPGMGLESSSGKDIANQPALNYGRIIADLRSLAGEQVKWALSIELVLAKGFDWFQENGGFDIAWPKWFVTGQEADIMQEEEDAGEKIQSGRGTGKTKVDDSSTSTSASHKRRY